MHRFSMRALVPVIVAVLVGAAPSPVKAAGLMVELDLEPSAEGVGVYEVTARIQDAESGEMLSVPTVVFPKGEDPARVTSSIQDGGSLEFRISVSPDESTVTYAVEQRVGDAVVASQKATIRMASQDE